MLIKVGTRKSKLALIQTSLVIQEINKFFPHIKCEIVPIITTGDLITNKPLYDIGGKALFLKEIEQQLLQKNIDIAVHSLKDMPGLLPSGLTIGAVLEREDPRDVLICEKFRSLNELPKGAYIGTSSPRRKIFVHHQRPDINVIPFRGNVDSRLSRLKEKKVDALILAASGLKRLDLFSNNCCYTLDIQEIIPSVGQGVIAVEIRKDNDNMQDICNYITHLPTWQEIIAERAFLEYLNADCKTPLAAHATIIEDNLKIDCMLADFEENYVFFHTEIGKIQEASKIGLLAAQKLLSQVPK